MALSFNFGGTALQIIWQVLLWIVLIGGILTATVGLLWLRKKFRLKYPVLEIVGLGNGKVQIKNNKAGFFKQYWLMGLIDYKGEEVFMTRDGRIIQNASAEDLHEINGSSGFIVLRKGDDPKVLVPLDKIDKKLKSVFNIDGNYYSLDVVEKSDPKTKISKSVNRLIPVPRLHITNPELISTIAPADYRDTAIRLKNRAFKETAQAFERYAPMIVGTVMVMLLFITVLFVIQYVRRTQTEALQFTLEATKSVASRNVAGSDAPLFLPFFNPLMFNYLVSKIRKVMFSAKN